MPVPPLEIWDDFGAFWSQAAGYEVGAALAAGSLQRQNCFTSMPPRAHCRGSALGNLGVHTSI